MRSAERLSYNLTVPRLQIVVVLFASVMAWAQTSRADLQGAQLGVAAEHLQQGKAEQAIRECKGVLAADPRSAPAHMLLGLAYLGQGSMDMIAEAKAELQQALDLDAELLQLRGLRRPARLIVRRLPPVRSLARQGMVSEPRHGQGEDARRKQDRCRSPEFRQ